MSSPGSTGPWGSCASSLSWMSEPGSWVSLSHSTVILFSALQSSALALLTTFLPLIKMERKLTFIGSKMFPFLSPSCCCLSEFYFFKFQHFYSISMEGGFWLLSAGQKARGLGAGQERPTAVWTQMRPVWALAGKPRGMRRGAAAAAGRSGSRGLWLRRVGRRRERWSARSLNTKVYLQDNTRLDLQRAEALHGDEPETL